MSWTAEQFEARGGCDRFPTPAPFEDIELEEEIPDCELEGLDEEEDPERFDGQS